MDGSKAEILKHLHRQIMPLQGYKASLNANGNRIDLGPVNDAFPQSVFPVGAVHEFIAPSKENEAASIGFITALLGQIMNQHGIILSILNKQNIFPHGLNCFGVNPAQIIFIHTSKEKEVLWVMEEALKCNGIAGVVAEVSDLSFTASRRLQLAVEQSGVTGFIIRSGSRILNNTTCVTRWKILSMPSVDIEHLPGVGYLHWRVELIKVRNGKPGIWNLYWKDGRFMQVQEEVYSMDLWKRKTG